MEVHLREAARQRQASQHLEKVRDILTCHRNTTQVEMRECFRENTVKR
jgi:hypothetical protein